MTEKPKSSGGCGEPPQTEVHNATTKAEVRLVKILASILSSGAQGKISEGRASELAQLLVQAVRDFQDPDPKR